MPASPATIGTKPQPNTSPTPNPALINYLLVSSASVEIDLDHKNDNGDWVIINYQVGDTIELKSIDLSFPIEQIYQGLTLTPESEQS
ncbi:MAG: hypothetical protein RLZZ511_1912 [Cyanobacteriota bacterium]|jgi:Uma2 family endonuclease